MSGSEQATFSLVAIYARRDNPTAGELGGFFDFGQEKVLLRDGGCQQRP
jgi:hypothetical protein